MCLRFEDHCRTTTLLPYGSDESTEVHGKWTDNVLLFYGYDVNCKRLERSPLGVVQHSSMEFPVEFLFSRPYFRFNLILGGRVSRPYRFDTHTRL